MSHGLSCFSRIRPAKHDRCSLSTACGFAHLFLLAFPWWVLMRSVANECFHWLSKMSHFGIDHSPHRPNHSLEVHAVQRGHCNLSLSLASPSFFHPLPPFLPHAHRGNTWVRTGRCLRPPFSDSPRQHFEVETPTVTFISGQPSARSKILHQELLLFGCCGQLKSEPGPPKLVLSFAIQISA